MSQIYKIVKKIYSHIFVKSGSIYVNRRPILYTQRRIHFISGNASFCAICLSSFLMAACLSGHLAVHLVVTFDKLLKVIRRHDGISPTD